MGDRFSAGREAVEALAAEPAAEASAGAVEYNTELTIEHSYLGQDLEDIHGRSLLDENGVYQLLVLARRSLTLIPGQTLPLLLHRREEIRIVTDLIKKRKVFGVLYPGVSKFGTTAEVRSFKIQTDDQGIPTALHIKAEGCQRFEVLESHFEEYHCFATARILPDLKLLSPERSLLIERTRPRHLAARCLAWPSFVCERYEEKALIAEVSRALAPIVGKIPPVWDATKFSYWVTANLPVNDNVRPLLLEAGCAQERLRMAITYLQLDCNITCRSCSNVISTKDSIICMSKDGAQGTYVNGMGYLFEMVTVKRAQNVRHDRDSTEEYSWFPGYAWRQTECSHCFRHLGWRFDTTKNLDPPQFWGFSRQSLTFKTSHDRLSTAESQSRPQEPNPLVVRMVPSYDIEEMVLDDEPEDEDTDGE